MNIADILNFFRLAHDLRGAVDNLTVSNPILHIFPDYLRDIVHIRLDLVVENHSNRPATIPSVRVSIEEGAWYESLPRNPIADNVDFHEELAKAALSGPLSESASELPATIPPLEMRRILIWLTVPRLSELPGQLLGAVHTLKSLAAQAHSASTMNTACTYGLPSYCRTAASIAERPAEADPHSRPSTVLQLQFRVRGKLVPASVALQSESY